MILPPRRFRSEQGQLEPATLFNAVVFVAAPFISNLEVGVVVPTPKICSAFPFIVATDGLELVDTSGILVLVLLTCKLYVCVP